ncbi:MAG: hypothetical protein ACM3S1_15285 [Hyphomicrobiales bacterium]
MPTHDEDPRFIRDYRALTPAQQAAFKEAVKKFREDLEGGGPFRPSLRVKQYKRLEDVWELSWAPDGRALSMYGTSIRPGDVHIIWLRVGTHDIFRA